MVSYVAVISRKSALVFSVFSNRFSVNNVRAVTCLQILWPWQKSA